MIMYKLPHEILVGDKLVQLPFVCKVSEPPVSIPFDPANTDYQKFKADVLAGAELQDADGNVMSQEAVTAFISELP